MKQGVCNNGVCLCFPGYTGVDCSSGCLNDCSKHGQCLQNDEGLGYCKCDRGYKSTDCSIGPSLTSCAVSCADHCWRTCSSMFKNDDLSIPNVDCKLPLNECYAQRARVIDPGNACYGKCTDKCMTTCGEDYLDEYYMKDALPSLGDPPAQQTKPDRSLTKFAGLTKQKVSELVELPVATITASPTKQASVDEISTTKIRGPAQATLKTPESKVSSHTNSSNTVPKLEKDALL